MSQQGLSLKMSHDSHSQDALFLKNVGWKVRNCRTSRNLGLEDISIRSGLPPRILADLENGTADIHLNDLALVAGALGVATIDLVDITFG